MTTLPNGLKVLYKQDASFPLVAATLLFPIGARQEARGQEGLASMTIDLLMQGTRKRNAKEIARVMEAVGASMGTQGHEDYSEMGFLVPSGEINRAFNVMGELLTEPAFPKEEIVKEKSHIVASLLSRKDEIFNLAFDPLNETLFGPHPYGRPLEGHASSVKQFSRRDFQNWHRRFIGPERAVLSMIGPMPPPVAMQKLTASLRHWKTHNEEFPQTVLPRMPSRNSEKVIRSTFQQAYLMVGYAAPNARHPSHIALKVLNTLLGGGMSSVLFLELREKLGLAYEVSSFYPSRLDSSLWVIYLGLPAEKLNLAERKLRDILKRLAQRGPGADDLLQAKAMIRGAFLMDLQSRRRQAWYSAWWEYLDRGPHYGEEFLKLVDAVSVKTLQDLLQQILAQPKVTVKVIPK